MDLNCWTRLVTAEEVHLFLEMHLLKELCFSTACPTPGDATLFPFHLVIAAWCPVSLLFPAQLLISSKLLGTAGILTLSRCPRETHPPLSPKLAPEERYQQLLTANTAWDIHIQTRKA